MAKTKSNQKKRTQSTKTQKKGKKRWLILFLLLIIGAVFVAIRFFNIETPLDSFFNEPEIGELSLENIEVELDKNTRDLIGLESTSTRNTKGRRQRSQTRFRLRKGKYYIKIEDCVEKKCSTEVSKYLKTMRLPSTKKRYTKQIKYYELLSLSYYTIQRGKNKIRMLKKYHLDSIPPYLVSDKKNRYRVSFGLFPSEKTGRQKQSELATLFPKTETRFVLEPRVKSYSVTSIYTGPFAKQTAERVLYSLQSSFDFESSKIVGSL